MAIKQLRLLLFTVCTSTPAAYGGPPDGWPTEMHFCALHCNTWVWEDGEYRSSPHGATYATIRIEKFAPDAVVMYRQDPPNAYFPRGLKFTYFGTYTPGSHTIANGSQVATFGTTGTQTFSASWGPALGEVPGSDAERDRRRAETDTGAAPSPAQSSATATSSDEDRQKARKIEEEARKIFDGRWDHCLRFKTNDERAAFFKRVEERRSKLRADLAKQSVEGNLDAYLKINEQYMDTSTHLDPHCTDGEPSTQAPDSARSESGGKLDVDKTEAAIDRKFAQWSLSWAMDRYQPGSARVDSLDCGSGGCSARGHFTFFRVGVAYQIPFAAAIQSDDKGFWLGRLCYDDVTTGSQDCVD